MDNLTEFFKVLSDETRLRIIHLLTHQELCVCELVDILNLSQPKISKHIAKIRQAGLVNTRRKEQFILYSFDNSNNSYMNILSSIFEEVETNNTLKKDYKKLQLVESFHCNN
jgi:ArsR family transcriptional regulator